MIFNMKKSYQILEPEILEELLNIEKQSIETIISILSWISYKISNDLRKRRLNIEIDVIQVEYVGKYPALGAYYKDQEIRTIDESEDVEALVNLLCETIVKEADFSEYIHFLINNKDKISQDLKNYKSY